MIGCYGRVSTPDQNLARQINNILGFAVNNLDAELGGVTPEDISALVDDNAIKSPSDFGDVRIYFDRATGTNTDRGGFRNMEADVHAGDLDAVVVHSISRLARSIRDLDRLAEEIVEDNDTGLYVLSQSFELLPDEEDPYQRAMFQLLGVFAELEAEMTRRRVQEGIQTRMQEPDYHHGPPPLGFKKDDGYLIESDGYDRVRAVLELVLERKMSKRQAAKELDTSRRTINRSLERLELYGLEHLEDNVDEAGGEQGKVANERWGAAE